MKVGYNKSTKELIGYSKPVNGKSILVTAYDMATLEKKFRKEVNMELNRREYVKNHSKAMNVLDDIDKRESESFSKILKKIKEG